jgi:hypothetical protein
VPYKSLDFASFSRLSQHGPKRFGSTCSCGSNIPSEKLFPYDEEESQIWFCLIEAQFAAAGIKSQKLKYANTLPSLPK